MIKLRQFQSGDLNALYAISLATGHEGGDASCLYQDAKLMGHIYSAPYVLLEPDGVIKGFEYNAPNPIEDRKRCRLAARALCGALPHLLVGPDAAVAREVSRYFLSDKIRETLPPEKTMAAD